MNLGWKPLAAATAFGLFAGAAAADIEAPNVELNINGDTPITVVAPAPDFVDGLSTIYSGWLFRDQSTRLMETDDFENPGMPSVDEGTASWYAVDGAEGKSCASCHGEIDEGMKGVRASMPKVNGDGELWSMEDYINNCRTTRMGAEAWNWDKDPMKNMTGAIALQSRGMPVDVAIDGAAAPFWEEGKEMYYTRYGLLQLSCANCHEDHYDDYIRGDHLSQGQLNAFPVFRLKTGGLVSIHNRLYGCIRDTRAESFAKGSQELRVLELYVASRGNGLSIEGVGVRP